MKVPTRFRLPADWVRQAIRNRRESVRGLTAHRRIALDGSTDVSTSVDEPEKGRLERYFDARATGQGIWKWRHYFDAYERHFGKFVGKEVRVLEIGVYSGGSLAMWRDYFGPRSQIYGVDIEPACTEYRGEGVEIFIGDQADRGFWRQLARQIGWVDIVIDDGGHASEQQIVTFEETFALIRPGGVYVCEDVSEMYNPFMAYVHAFSERLNGGGRSMILDGDRGFTFAVNETQAVVHSIHHYPYLVVIEKRVQRLRELLSERHGTQWQPFLRVPTSDPQ